MITLGVDFGTSSTVAVVGLDGGRAVPLLFGETPLLPSAVCFGPDGALIVGRDAVRAARSRPEAFEPHPKARIDDGQVLLGEREVPVPELIGAVLGRVRDEAVRVAGAGVDRLVLTHPAGWGAHRRQTLAEAAAVAGLPAPVLVAEPVAAAAYFVHVLGQAIPAGKCIVVYDFGAGTFDASVVRRNADGFEVLAAQGLPDTGGLDVDAAIVAHLGAVHGGRDPAAWGRLTSPSTPDDRRASRAFWDDVRTGKEELSRASSTTIFAPILDLDAVVGREQLDDLARPLLDRTVDATGLAVRNAGIGTEDVAAVFLVGGASRMSLAGTLLHRALGVAPMVIEQPELIVAGGTLHVPSPQPAPVTAIRPPAPQTPAAAHRWRLPVAVLAAVLAAAVVIVMLNRSPAVKSSGLVRSTAASATVTASPFATLQGHTGQVTAVAFSPDRRTMTTAGLKDGIMVWDVSSPAAPKRIATADEQDSVELIAYSPDGRIMATDGRGAAVIVWDMTDPAVPRRIATLNHKWWMYAIEFSPDGKTMVTSGGDHTVVLWSMADPAAPKRIATLPGDDLRDRTAAVFSPDGKTLATAEHDNSVALWSLNDTAGLKRIATLPAFKEGVRAVRFSPDGRTLVTVGDSVTIIVWNVTDPAAPQLSTTLPRPRFSVGALAFSPNGRTMALSSWRTVTLWSMADPAAPARIGDLEGHSDTVSSVEFSPDGRTLATAANDHTARLWPLPAG
ncbi:Hsp70 family protein [Dactylosporangium sp. NPDC000244]|uniref:Hsp70 family protein n=1 Tax=Dactylosporangium sp. NPDC000244 TaxID=3154365 RepID=UPI003329B3C6